MKTCLPVHTPLAAGAVVNSYPVGGTITISILIQSQHGGRHMFRLCDQATADEACLAAHVLERWAGAVMGPKLGWA